MTIPANSEATVSAKKLEIDRLTIRDLIVEELKHILEVEQMEDGKYKVIFASGMEEEEEPEEEAEEEIIEETIDELEESKAGDHGYEDDEEKDDEDDKKDKGFLTDSERDLLRYILQS